MTTAEIKATRRANRAAIDAALKARTRPADAKSLPLYKTPPAYKLLTPEERAALVTAENSKPKAKSCC